MTTVAPPVAVLAALLVSGRWSDAIGRRPVLLAGAAAGLASAVVFLVADDVPLLLVGRLLSGPSAGIFTGTATAAVIEAVPSDQRDRGAAVATAANMGGLGIGPILAGLLVPYAPCNCPSSSTSCWWSWQWPRCCWPPKRRRAPDASASNGSRYPLRYDPPSSPQGPPRSQASR